MKLYRHGFQAMGTACEVQLFARILASAQHAARLIVTDVARLERRYSRYREDSFLSEINRFAAVGGKIEVDAETAGLLNYAAACYEQSGGLFDITSGVLRKAWSFDLGRTPEPGQIECLLEKVGWHRLGWTPPRLDFPVAGMEIDFGGIAKEYAVDRAVTLAREAGVYHGVINLGGDIRIIGPRPDDAPWRIGIRHPERPEVAFQTLSLSRGALASSGDYERCFLIGGLRYGHILDPRTGWPTRHLASVSVLADFCMVAGSASTIAILMGEGGPAWLEQLGLPHVWMTIDGRIGGPLAPIGLAQDLPQRNEFAPRGVSV
jgi:thiamine biosynthesis lipoprotein